MADNTLFTTIRRLLRGHETRPVICLMATVAFGALLIGGGLGGGWLYGTLFGYADPRFGDRVGNVTDENLLVGFTAGAALWLLSIIIIWWRTLRFRGDLSNRRLRWTIIKYTGITLAVAAGITAMSIYLDWRPRLFDEREVAITALALLGGGCVLLLWMPVLDECVFGRLDRQANTETAVRCLRCDYSMTGLRTPVCPECGEAYTLDELLAGQLSLPNAGK